MNKFLRYATCLLMTLFFGTAMAAPITFDPASDKGTQAGSSTGADEVTKDGVTISVSPTGSFGNGQQYRVYKESTFTVKSTAGTITSVIITCSASGEEKYGPGNFTSPTAGEYTFSGTTGTWTGSATEFSLTASGAQVRMTKIEVYLNGETPGVDPGPGPGPSDETIFDFDNKADELFPGMGRSSGTGSSYVPDGEFNENTTSTAVNGATVTVSASPSDASTRNRLWTTSPVLRMYNGTLTVNAPQNIKSMIITVGWNSSKKAIQWSTDNTVNTGTMVLGDQENQTVTWTGDASEVVFTIAANSQIKKIELGFDAVEPTLEITGTTPFVGSTTVTIKGGTDVYYTIDGSDPADENNINAIPYTAPFIIIQSCTVKAYDDASGLSAEKEFVRTEVSSVANIAAFKALESGTDATLTLNDAQVLYVSGNDMYVRDATGAIDFYQTGFNFTAGQKLNGSVTGQFKLYNNLPELVKTDATNSNDIIASAGTAEPKVVTPSAAQADQYLCDLIKIEGATIESREETNNGQTFTNTYAIVNGEELLIYNKYNVTMPTDLTKTYDVEGILVIFKGAYELYITNIYESGTTPGPGPSITEVDNIAAFVALAENTTAKLTLTNAEVVKSWTSNAGNTQTFVRDASGAIQFYNCGLGLETGDLVNGTVVLQFKVYNGEPEAVAVSGKTNADELIISKNAAQCQPKEVGVDAAASNVNDLVTFKGVTVVKVESTESAAGDPKYYATDVNGNQVQIYNGFHDTAFDNLDTFVGSKAYDVTGIIVAYQSKSMTEPIYEIYPVEIQESSSTGITEVSVNSLDVNAPIYNLAGQRVDATFKGVVLQNGKKFINK